MNLEDNINQVRKRLVSHTEGGNDMSLAGKYARGTRGEDGAPIGDTFIATSRQLPPDKNYYYGVNKEPLGKVPGPYTVEAPLMQNYGPHRPVWRGWRPKRPETNYPTLGVAMPEPDRTYRMEPSIPGENEVVNMAMRNTMAPYPAVPQGEGIPDPSRNLYMKVQSELSGYLGYMGYMGDDTIITSTDGPTQPDAASGILSSIAGALKKIAAPATPVKSLTVVTPTPASTIPWGTIALVGGGAILAMFVLPKLLK